MDGPSGAGKSTMAKRLAEALGFVYVDTGAIYRTLGLLACRQGVAPDDAAAVTALLPDADIHLRYGSDGLQHMYLGGEDVTESIRRPEISQYASSVSAIPAVRAFLLNMQRDLARTHDVIMDGRDIGTVVLPDADLKIYLTASAEERASRRYLEMEDKPDKPTYDQILEDIKQRDYNDMHRAVSPLRQADDAVLIDSTTMGFHEVCEEIMDLIEQRLDVE